MQHQYQKKMKILAVGRNYTDHAAELHEKVPEQPVVFLKPDTALLKNNAPFYYPAFSENIHYEAEIILRVCKQGKYIEEKFAHKYYDAIGLGIDFTARDLQQTLKQKGYPWDIAKGFNQSAPVSVFIDKEVFDNIHNLDFSLFINGKSCQKSNTAYMLFSFEKLITYMSKFFTLKKGDIIFTGTPAGVGPVQINDHLEGYIEDREMLNFLIK